MQGRAPNPQQHCISYECESLVTTTCCPAMILKSHDGSSVPRNTCVSFSNPATNRNETQTYHVTLSCADSFQNAIGSNPAHITTLPPDIMGAKRFLTIPPT